MRRSAAWGKRRRASIVGPGGEVFRPGAAFRRRRGRFTVFPRFPVFLAGASGSIGDTLHSRRGKAMRTYRVYFLARGDEVVGSRSFDAEDDRAARAKAEELCRDHHGCAAVEIWDGGWPVYWHCAP